MEDKVLNYSVMVINRENIVEIINKEFAGDIKSFAEEIGINDKYFNELLTNPTRKAGVQTLGKIYEYCKRTGRNPESYIFK